MSTTPDDAGEAAPLPQADWLHEEGVGPAISTIAEPGVSVEGHRETTRSQLARRLMGLLTITVISILILAALQVVGVVTKPTISIQDIAQAVLTPVVTLTATALGFYFGAHTAASSGSSGLGLPTPREPGWLRRLARWIW